ncbi:TonB-dependent receptor [Roseiterribacter gracilis]|uniref:Siderophore receptor n=1 Tax=Roseiterribacter gracilis TaxID=2812848 RepID=A0A8S8XD10_9PROT|nr:siderophore receptor [Rhodospirillales bacterium TMPK1]
MVHAARGFLIVTATLATGPALAQSAVASGPIDEITVTGSRLPAKVTSIPGSVTVIKAEEVMKQADVTPDLGAMLSQLVPGMAPSAYDASSYAQTLRGRKPVVLIDGVTQSMPLRGGRDLKILSASVIERVEVIRGSTAIYGQSGAGGVINYITKQPRGEGFNFNTSVGLGSSLTKLDSGGLQYYVNQSATGAVNRVDFVFDGSFESLGMFRGSDGRLIPPDPGLQGGLADTKSYNVFGKIGFTIDDQQRIEVAGGHYERAQDTDWTSGSGIYKQVFSPAVLKTSRENVLRAGQVGEDARTENTSGTVTYTHGNVFGSKLQVQALYSEHYDSYTSIFQGAANFTPETQSYIQGRKWGGRLDIDTPINFASTRILWGVDFLVDKTAQPTIDGRLFMPWLRAEDISFFAQMQSSPTEWLDLRAGLRRENITLDVPTYTVLPQPISRIVGGNTVQGGKLDYSDTLVNAGAVVHLGPIFDVFGGYSQGFSIGDIGRVLRSPPVSVRSLAQLQLGAQVINSYEVGVRAHVGNVSAELVGFRNTSALGTTLDPVTGVIVRAPERVKGLEFSTDIRLSTEVRVGGTFTWMEGEFTSNNVTLPLDFTRVPPRKTTAYISYDFVPGWNVLLQGQMIATENRFNLPSPKGGGRGDVKGYILADLVIAGPVGPGRASLAISNLFNETFSPIVNQTADFADLRRTVGYAQGPGRAALVRYSVSY